MAPEEIWLKLVGITGIVSGKSYRDLQIRCKQIFVIGLSMGGALAF